MTLVQQIPEEAAESGKLRWTNFKREVWHGGMGVIINPLAPHSELGFSTICGDVKERCLCPGIPLWSSDMKEAYVFSLLKM